MSLVSKVQSIHSSYCRQLIRLTGAASVALLLGACNNYTTAPVCHGGNAASPAGMTGVYTLSTQKEDFTVETQKFSIGVDAAGKMKLKSAAGDEKESSLCEINGQLIQEDELCTAATFHHWHGPDDDADLL